MGRSRGNQDISSVLLRYEVDDRSVSASLKAADAVMQRYRDLAAGAGDVGKAVDGTQQIMQRQTSTLGDQSAAMDRANRLMQRMNTVQDDAKQVLSDYREELERTGRSYKDAVKDTEEYRHAQTGLSSLSSAMRGVGLGGVAGVTDVGADIFGGMEEIGRIGPALREAGDSALSAVNNFTGLDMSLGQLALVGGGAAAAAALIVASVTAIFQRSQEIADEYARVQAARRAGEMAAQQAIETMTSTEREAEIDVVRAALSANNQSILDYTQEAMALAETLAQEAGPAWVAANADIADGIDNLNEAQKVLGYYGEGIARIATTGGVQELNNQLEDLEGLFADLDKLSLETNDLIGRMEKLTSAEADTKIATNDAAVAEAQLAEARKVGENAALTAATATARAADVTAARSQYTANIDALDAAREMVAFEEELAGVRKQARGSASTLQDAARQRVDSLEAQYTKAEATANTAIAKIQADTGKKRAEVEAKYMAESVKATRDYLAVEGRYEDKAARERVRRTEDMLDDQLQAEEDNDVIAFIRATRAGAKDLRRMAEDEDAAAKQRTEEFAAEQAQRVEEQKTRVADLKSDADERIAQIRQGLREQRDTIDEQIRQEGDALRERLRLNQQALIAELDIRRKGHALGLQEEAAYAQQRLALQQQLDNALLAISSRSYSGLAVKGGGYSATMSSKSYTRPLTTTSGVSPVFNITMGNIGSNISKTEVQASLVGAVKAFSAATIAGMSGGK